MNWFDILLIGLIVAIFIRACYKIYKNVKEKKGCMGCSGNCSRCDRKR
ncbi:MAG: FeoB-associated Cys-rich membrane protein [Lachnospiraceae bacterium]|nr:FeoB-associated Cys-rich membrane protein [Lachnospiraceae bacterium]